LDNQKQANCLFSLSRQNSKVIIEGVLRNVKFNGGGESVVDQKLKPKALGALIKGEKDAERRPPTYLQKNTVLISLISCHFCKKGLVIVTKTGIIAGFRDGCNLPAKDPALLVIVVS